MGRPSRGLRGMRQIALLAQCVGLLTAVRASLRVLRLERTRRWTDRLIARRAPLAEPKGPSPEALARMVERATAVAPWGRHCLSRAITLEVLLGRRGRSAETQYGIARSSDGGIEAHAWVTCEGRVLLGGEELERFTVMTAPGRELD